MRGYMDTFIPTAEYPRKNCVDNTWQFLFSGFWNLLSENSKSLKETKTPPKNSIHKNAMPSDSSSSVQEAPNVRRRRSQGVFWSVTIPGTTWPQEGGDARFRVLADSGKVSYVKGQLERGSNGGYLHWQVFAGFASKVSLPGKARVYARWLIQ